MRYFMDISYLGTPYHGWQIQNNAITVQEVLQKALTQLLSEPIDITGSGRTDTGVHAKQQIAHFDTEVPIDVAKLAYRLNSYLPPSIAINNISLVQNQAHARFDASSRQYIYEINRFKSTFKEGLSWYHRGELDLAAINKACAVLIRTSDFESFSRVKTEVNNFNCHLSAATWEATSDGFRFTVSANRFLRGMVRALVGTLMDVGLKKLSADKFALIVEQRDRRAAGAAAPAHGLYLSQVIYPSSIYQLKN
jgi:tRNA pseudouridine38-40 synthase